ncbi:hypothetical protein C1141_05095 [Vibrio agarivorans]|nr:hypothetical protein C1141_05095 [Vibrio agarivorans]
MLKSFAFEKFSLKAEVNSSEIIESVKHFFYLFSLELLTLSNPAKALLPLPCQWMRIIGSLTSSAIVFFKKTRKKTCSLVI